MEKTEKPKKLEYPEKEKAQEKTQEKAQEKTQLLWNKCPSCDEIIYKKDLEGNFKICPKCNYYLRMSAIERINLLADRKEDGALEFQEFDADFSAEDPLEFTDPAFHPHPAHPGADGKGVKNKSSYAFKLLNEQKKTGHLDAVICGEALIGKHAVVMAVMDFEFMGGSMGSVVGEKVTRAAERSLKSRNPLILVSASGGARMQEGILSLMQMAKTSAAIALLNEAGILVISILCDPTTGGVTASFAMLGDIMMAEPKALVAFAGPRVIEQTIRQQLPEGFQLSEFLMQHGMVDCIVERKNLKSQLVSFLNFFAQNAKPR